MTPPPIPIEAVAALPLPGTAVPNHFQFSPDGKWLLYLDSSAGSLVKQLYRRHLEEETIELLVDAAQTGATEQNLSLEEQLRRERLRQRTLGISQYSQNRQGQLLIPLPGGLFVLDKAGEPLRQLISTEKGTVQNGRFSPDGQTVAYVQNDELHIIPTHGGSPKQLTFGAKETRKTHGLAEYIAQEELGRNSGYWWSPDSQRIAFVEVDESHIPIYRIVHQGKEKVGVGAEEDHRYPFAGEANAKVKLGVVDLANGDITWMDLGQEEDFYLARVNWVDNGRLAVQRLNRLQNELTLLSLYAETGKATPILTERSEVWINLHNLFKSLPPSQSLPQGGFIWGSERTGFMHLYLYDWDGDLIRPLTSGEWLVDSVHGVDEDVVYFMSSKESPLQKQLYSTDLEGNPPQQVTQGGGIHHVKLHLPSRRFVDIYSNHTTPYSITINNLPSGKQLQPLFNAPESHLAPPQIISFENRHGDTLYGAFYKPPANFGDGPFPTIVSVYGGPHAQRVTDQWLLTADMRAQYLSQQGFLIFKCDNRGSARRGLAFEASIKHNMGQAEVDDQVDGVRWLMEQGLTDEGRVGIYGWSYGGYMALMALARAGDLFGTAVAGAPVTHWDGYDTGYTERYMGTPQSNPDGYEKSSVMAHIDKINGNLLLIHGLIDENVHFRHTARLINALNRARKRYDLRLFPDERHAPRGEADRVYMEEFICNFFTKYLLKE